ncbi:hypothetical protein LCGC14_0837080, partial [marine sediment metagenome]
WGFSAIKLVFQEDIMAKGVIKVILIKRKE